MSARRNSAGKHSLLEFFGAAALGALLGMALNFVLVNPAAMVGHMVGLVSHAPQPALPAACLSPDDSRRPI